MILDFTVINPRNGLRVAQNFWLNDFSKRADKLTKNIQILLQNNTDSPSR